MKYKSTADLIAPEAGLSLLTATDFQTMATCLAADFTSLSRSMI